MIFAVRFLCFMLFLFGTDDADFTDVFLCSGIRAYVFAYGFRLRKNYGEASCRDRSKSLLRNFSPEAEGLWIDIDYLYHSSNSSGVTNKSLATASTSLDEYFLVVPCFT